jgi:hypothetical protein
MRRVYQVLCHLIAAFVVLQAAVIAWSTFAILGSGQEGADLNVDSGLTGFSVHSAVGQIVIPLLALGVLVVALIARAGIKWAVWLVVAVLVQVLLGYTSFGLPGLGLLHGVNAFIVLGLAETAAASVAVAKKRAPVAARTATDDTV